MKEQKVYRVSWMAAELRTAGCMDFDTQVDAQMYVKKYFKPGEIRYIEVLTFIPIS